MFPMQLEDNLRTIILQNAETEEGLLSTHSAAQSSDEGPSVETEQAPPLNTASGTVDMLNQLC